MACTGALSWLYILVFRNKHTCEEFLITIVQNTRKRYDLSIIHIVP